MAKKQTQSKFNNRKALSISLGVTLPVIAGLGIATGLHFYFSGKQASKTLQQIVDQINNVLELKTKCNTMLDALDAVKSTYDVEVAQLEDNQQFVWDQSANRFIVLDKDDELVFGPKDYTLNENKWQLWKMVTEDEFDSYSQYSQYLRKSKTNLTKKDYSFIAGFDSGKNEDVKNIHYFYEDMGKNQYGKDIIINTCSIKTNVDVSAWTGTEFDWDEVTHYGQMGELNVVTNGTYQENGKALVSQVYGGEITIAADANIELTYVKASVTLKDFKQTGKLVDKICAIHDVIAEVQAQYPGAVEATQTQFDSHKETIYSQQEEPIAPSYAIAVVDNETNEVANYNTLTEISNLSNADTPELFENKTIYLNKDYDMTLESSTWTQICNSYSDYNKAFLGTFDGQNHSILNFSDSHHHVALFGISKGDLKNINFVNCHRECTDGAANPLLVVRLADNANVDNVHCYNCSIKGITNTAMIIFWIEPENKTSVNKVTNCSTDEDCVVYNNTKGTQTAGIIGQVSNVDHLYCENLINNATITGCKSVGGIIGQFGGLTNYGEFKSCINNGKITLLKVATAAADTPYYTGGLIGYLNCGSATEDAYVKFENCQNNGDVTITATKTETLDKLTVCGGLYGYSNGFAITCTDCINTGNIGLVKDQEGEIDCKWASGFSGYNNGAKSETFIRCENTGTIHANNGVGHFSVVVQGETQLAFGCTISSGTLIDADKRIKIPGEPD